MTSPVARQCPSRRHDHRRYRRHPGDARQRPDAVGIEIGSSENAAHPGHRARCRGVDAFDQRMSVGRTQRNAMQLTWRGNVIDITPLPGQKPLVFEAVQRTPDMVSSHSAAVGYPALTRIRRYCRRGGGRSSNSAGVG
jgi:hypothetical protein